MSRILSALGWWGILGGLAFWSQGCFYNSQWGEGKREQQRALQRAAPAELSRAEGTGEVALRPLRVRALATQRYTAQVVDAPRQFQESIDEANRVLSGMGVRIALESFKPWDAPEEDLLAALAALKAKETGRDVDGYVGLVGSLPRASASFHELGYAHVLGRHLVLRAPARADEVDAIERNLDELSSEERDRLTKNRRKHRAASLLLHELGHILGALHDSASASLMNPGYAPERSGFSPENVGLMQITLRHRGAREPDDRALAKELLSRLDGLGSQGAFVAKDREEMRALLKELSEPRAPAPPAKAAPAEPVPEDLQALSEQDRQIYRQTKELFAKGDAPGAWEKGKALFTMYPNSFPVQDLRCHVALGRFSYEKARPECDPVMRLTREAPGK